MGSCVRERITRSRDRTIEMGGAFSGLRADQVGKDVQTKRPDPCVQESGRRLRATPFGLYSVPLQLSTGFSRRVNAMYRVRYRVRRLSRHRLRKPDIREKKRRPPLREGGGGPRTLDAQGAFAAGFEKSTVGGLLRIAGSVTSKYFRCFAPVTFAVSAVGNWRM